MSPGHPPEHRKSSAVVFVAIAIVSVAFAVGLGLLIFSMVRPRGEKVGETSLTQAQASLVAQGKLGDSLVFRVDASLGIPRLSLLSDDELERQAVKQLQNSMLTVRAIAPSGSEHTSSCAVYNGRAMSTVSTPGTYSRSGMRNECVIVLDESGAWKISGSIAWSSDLALRSATLETRLDAR